MPGSRDVPRDPYEVLGVPANAGIRDIIRAYRRLARALHPDSRPDVTDDCEAAARFRAVSDAYELLSDPVRRAALDRRRQLQPRPADARSAMPHHVTGPGATQPVWPLGPGTISTHAQPPTAARPELWPGPARIETWPQAETSDHADMDVQLQFLRQFVRHYLSTRRDWPW